MRPRINTIRYKDWTHQDGSTSRGIAMYHKQWRVAQLTAAEAFILDYLKQQEACEAKAGDVIKAGRAEGFTDNQIKNARKRCKNPRIKSGSPVVGAGPKAAFDAKVAEIIRHLDQSGQADDIGRDAARDHMKSLGIGASTKALAEAVRQRKNRLGDRLV